MTKCADCFNCKVVGYKINKSGKYYYEVPAVMCVHFHKNKTPHNLHMVHSNKLYTKCRYFVSMND
jgi:hypothetical protein